MTTAHINAIGTAVPPHDVHQGFTAFIRNMLGEGKARRLFDRMETRSGIEQRFSFVELVTLPDGQVTDTEQFYGVERFPSTAERMARYERWAPDLAMRAIGAVSKDIAEEGITHLVVASCTGFVAPGIDQIIIERSGIDPSVERTVVGFMGCYAAVNALRTARHIVRSEPQARVLVVTVELCTLHFQSTADLDRILSMMLFGDGAAAAIVSAEPHGIALTDFRSAAIPGSADAITWRIGDQGFDMHLGGEVPARIAEALARECTRNDDDGLLRGQSPDDFDVWAVHAGGRTVLDAVERGFGLGAQALQGSRDVLREFGNLSSSTLMFVLAKLLGGGQRGAKGLGLAFGPGLAAESFRFSLV